MKILLGIPEYPPNHVGGGGEVFKNLAENYKKLGYDVVIIYGFYPTKSWFEDVKEYTDNNGIRFYQIPEIPYPKSKPFLRSAMPPNFRAWLKLKKIIQEEKPDVAHLHGYGLIFINILAGILRKLKIKYIFTIHGYPETQNRSNFLVKIVWNWYIKLIMNKTLNNAERITCVSEYIKNDIRNIFPEKSEIIGNGLNFSEFENVRNDINIREKYHISQNAKIIFSIGRISEMKGFQNIIKLIPKFLKQGIDVKYLIAGEDEGYKKELLRLIEKLGVEKNVEFVGFLDLETKKQYIEQCDIFAIPSLWEPFGLVALEGMIYNKMIVTSNAGGLKDILEEYKNKILIDDKEVVEKALKQKPQLPSADIFKKFDYKIIAEAYLNAMKTL